MASLRHGELRANPESGTLFQSGDRIGFIGDEHEMAAVEQLVSAWREGVDENHDST